MVIVEKRKTKPEKKDVDLNKQAVFRARPAIMDKIGQNVQILKLGAKTFTRNREQLPHTAVHFVLNDYWIYRKVTMRLPLVKVVNLNKQVVFRALEQNFKAWGENFPTESGAAAHFHLSHHWCQHQSLLSRPDDLVLPIIVLTIYACHWRPYLIYVNFGTPLHYLCL